jgi:hypothetical protein
VGPRSKKQISPTVSRDQAKWIDEIIPTLRIRLPLIKGVVWFNINKETDWRVSSSSASEASFICIANDPYFNPYVDVSATKVHEACERAETL